MAPYFWAENYIKAYEGITVHPPVLNNDLEVNLPAGRQLGRCLYTCCSIPSVPASIPGIPASRVMCNHTSTGARVIKPPKPKKKKLGRVKRTRFKTGYGGRRSRAKFDADGYIQRKRRNAARTGPANPWVIRTDANVFNKKKSGRKALTYEERTEGLEEIEQYIAEATERQQAKRSRKEKHNQSTGARRGRGRQLFENAIGDIGGGSGLGDGVPGDTGTPPDASAGTPGAPRIVQCRYCNLQSIFPEECSTRHADHDCQCPRWCEREGTHSGHRPPPHDETPSESNTRICTSVSTSINTNITTSANTLGRASVSSSVNTNVQSSVSMNANSQTYVNTSVRTHAESHISSTNSSRDVIEID